MWFSGVRGFSCIKSIQFKASICAHSANHLCQFMPINAALAASLKTSCKKCRIHPSVIALPAASPLTPSSSLQRAFSSKGRVGMPPISKAVPALHLLAPIPPRLRQMLRLLPNPLTRPLRPVARHALRLVHVIEAFLSRCRFLLLTTL